MLFEPGYDGGGRHDAGGSGELPPLVDQDEAGDPPDGEARCELRLGFAVKLAILTRGSSFAAAASKFGDMARQGPH